MATTELAKTKSLLPSIQELRDDESLSLVGKSNALNVLLNEQPNPKWVREHPYIKTEINGKKVGMPYIPIERLEWLMTRIFVRWRIEVKEVLLLANSIGVTVRVHYLDPVTAEWSWQDGVGAMPMQVDKDAGATDFSKIKSNAVQMGLPAAKSYAFKDAVEQLGNLFGKDLNRKDSIEYRSLLGQVTAMLTDAQVAEIETLLAANPVDRTLFLAIFGVEAVKDIDQKDFADAKAQLKSKLQ